MAGTSRDKPGHDGLDQPTEPEKVVITGRGDDALLRADVFAPTSGDPRPPLCRACEENVDGRDMPDMPEAMDCLDNTEPEKVVITGLCPGGSTSSLCLDVDGRDVGAKQSFVASPGHD